MLDYEFMAVVNVQVDAGDGKDVRYIPAKTFDEAKRKLNSRFGCKTDWAGIFRTEPKTQKRELVYRQFVCQS